MTAATFTYAFPRRRRALRRAGIEAATAFLFAAGAVATFFGAVILRHAAAVRYDAGDWHRILFLPLGVAFLGAAIWLVLGRPRQPVRWRRWTRRLLTAAAVGVLALFVVLPVGGAVWLTQKPRDPVHESAFAIAHERVTLHTSDGETLQGWYAPSRNRAAVVLVHGGGGNRDGEVRHALMLARHGYGVLLYDARGAGESTGSTQSDGWTWQPDVRAALDFLATRPDVDPRRIGGLGLSTGAEVLLRAEADDPRLAAVVADGAIMPSFAEAKLLRGADRIQGIPYWGVHFTALRVLSQSSPPPPLEQTMAKIAPRPVLLVASGHGPEPQLDRVYARAGGPTARLWMIPDASHTHGLATHPRRYEHRIVEFFDRSLLG